MGKGQGIRVFAAIEQSFSELVFTVTPYSPILFCVAVYPINYCFTGESNVVAAS